MADRPAPPHSRLYCTVYGQVQGVGFRWFVRDRARRLGLRGTVQNRADGAVVVHAEGPATSLAALRALLYDGPPGAVVERVEEEAALTIPLPESFTILR